MAKAQQRTNTGWNKILAHLGFGGLGGIGLACWEEVLAFGFGCAPLDGLQFGLVLLLYGMVGAALGGVLTLVRLGGGGAIWMAWILWTGLLLSAKWFAWKWGAWASLGLGFGPAAALGLLGGWGERHLAKKWPKGAWVVRAGAFAYISALFFLNLNVYGAALSAPALWMDGLLTAGTIPVLGVLVIVVDRWPKLGRRTTAWAVLGLAVPALAAVSVFVPPFPAPQPGATKGSPVVLIVVDTLRADHLETYGYPRPTTPHLKRHAQGALVYEQAMSTAPWTLPSFASLFTGRLPSAHGAGVNLGMRNTEAALDPELQTVAEVFEGQGLPTAAFVTNVYLSRPFGLHQGFDVYDDRTRYGHSPLIAQPVAALGVEFSWWMGYLSAATMADKAVSFVRSQGDSSYFLVVHFMDPHAPYRVNEKHLETLGEGYAAREEQLYDGEIRAVDLAIHRVLESLPDDAWVVLTSDHGEDFGDHPQPYDDFKPPHERHGYSQYQELLHVPLMVWGPGVEPRRISRPVSLDSVASTLLGMKDLELKGAAPPLSEFAKDTVKLRPQVSEALRYGRERKAVRQGQWKGIFGPMKVELYDLSTDPDELRDRVAEFPDQVEAMRAWLPTGAREGMPVNGGARLEEMLRTLGYTDEEPSP